VALFERLLLFFILEPECNLVLIMVISFCLCAGYGDFLFLSILWECSVGDANLAAAMGQ